MLTKSNSLWVKYKNYFIERLNFSDYSNKDGLPYIRDNLFFSVMIMAFPLSLLIYLPSIFFLLKINLYIPVIVDFLSILVFGFILFVKKLSITTRKILFFINFYILALTLLLGTGTHGPGLIILLALSILCTLLINTRAGLISVAIISITLFLMLFGFTIEASNLALFQHHNQSSWFLISLNFTILNLIVVLIMSYFIKHLKNLVSSKQNLLIKLNEESQNLLKAKEKSEESDRLKSAFLANMSHEIRTPMNGILGFSNILSNSDLSGDKQQEYIEIIQNSGKRMLGIINDIISISKIESGTIDVRTGEINLTNIIKSTFTFFKTETEKKGLELILTVDKTEKEVYINTDGIKLRSILDNLVKNAIKYTDTGSIEFGYHVKNKHIEFFVKDTGIGIPKDKVNKIFERFMQADIADKQVRQGAGLGLTISKAYAEMLGGNITVESEEGQGSTFYFSIPNNNNLQEISISNPAILDHVPDDLNLKILIVEDDEVSNKYLSILVKKYGRELINVEDGAQAVEECKLNPDIDLILLDIQLPILNGYEACKQIRIFNKDVIIIAQTAFGLSGDKDKVMNSGFSDYISKPIDKNELDKLILKHFK